MWFKLFLHKFKNSRTMLMWITACAIGWVINYFRWNLLPINKLLNTNQIDLLIVWESLWLGLTLGGMQYIFGKKINYPVFDKYWIFLTSLAMVIAGIMHNYLSQLFMQIYVQYFENSLFSSGYDLFSMRWWPLIGVQIYSHDLWLPITIAACIGFVQGISIGLIIGIMQSFQIRNREQSSTWIKVSAYSLGVSHFINSIFYTAFNNSISIKTNFAFGLVLFVLLYGLSTGLVAEKLDRSSPEQSQGKKYKIFLTNIICLSLTIYFGLLFVIPAINISPSEKLPDIGIPESEINTKIAINIPEGWNTFKTDLTISMDVKNISNEQIIFPADFGAKLYILKNNHWIEIQNDLKYSGGQEILSSTGKEISKHGVVSVTPVISESEKSAQLLIILIGNFYRNGEITDEKTAGFVITKIIR